MTHDTNAVSYVLYTQPFGGGEPIEEFPAEILKYTYRLNRPGSIEFTLSLDDHKTRAEFIAPGKHEVVVKRNGAIVWCGPILTAAENEASRTIAFGGEGLMGHMRRWYVTATLQTENHPEPVAGAIAIPEEQFEIARALVDHHQAKTGGDFGIDTTGTDASGVDRDRTYFGYELKNIFEALTQLGEVINGFDFEVNPATRRLTFFYPQRGRDTEVIFDDRNVRSFSRNMDATGQASQVLGVGAGDEDGMLRRDATSTEAIAEYGLTQTIYTNKDVSVAATLDGHIETLLDKTDDVDGMHGTSFTTSATDPVLFSYELGDVVRLIWNSPYDPLAASFRIVGQDVTWQSGEETVVQYVEPA